MAAILSSSSKKGAVHYIINLYYTSKSSPDKFAFDRNRHHTYKANRRSITFGHNTFRRLFWGRTFRLVRLPIALLSRDLFLAGDTERRLQYLWGHREKTIIVMTEKMIC